MRDIENTIIRDSNPSPRRRGRRAALAAALPVAGLLLIVGCDGMEEGEPVDVQTSALRNTGRTSDQQQCDEKLQDCYVDCSVKYPESGGGLNDDLREGCFDACDAAHNLCAPALTSGTTADVLQPAAVLDAQSTTMPAPIADVAVAPTADAAVKSCTPTTDGGQWCCVAISTPPYLKCTYTPPPDTIWTFTQTAKRAP